MMCALILAAWPIVTWGTNPGFASSKPTPYLLGYGDFTHNIRGVGKYIVILTVCNVMINYECAYMTYCSTLVTNLDEKKN